MEPSRGDKLAQPIDPGHGDRLAAFEPALFQPTSQRLLEIEAQIESLSKKKQRLVEQL